MIIAAKSAKIVIAPSLIPYTFNTIAIPKMTPSANQGREIRMCGLFIQ